MENDWRYLLEQRENFLTQPANQKSQFRFGLKRPEVWRFTPADLQAGSGETPCSRLIQAVVTQKQDASMGGFKQDVPRLAMFNGKQPSKYLHGTDKDFKTLAWQGLVYRNLGVSLEVIATYYNQNLTTLAFVGLTTVEGNFLFTDNKDVNRNFYRDNQGQVFYHVKASFFRIRDSQDADKVLGTLPGMDVLYKVCTGGFYELQHVETKSEVIYKAFLGKSVPLKEALKEAQKHHTKLPSTSVGFFGSNRHKAAAAQMRPAAEEKFETMESYLDQVGRYQANIQNIQNSDKEKKKQTIIYVRPMNFV